MLKIHTHKLLTLALSFVAAWSMVDSAAPLAAGTIKGHVARVRSERYPWHGGYNHVAYGEPVALVVPPRVGNHVEYAWGVGGTRRLPIYHQFRPNFPGYAPSADYGFRTPPPWPSDTTQFGVYYIRGPW